MMPHQNWMMHCHVHLLTGNMSVSKMMLDTAVTKHQDAMDLLNKEQKSPQWITYNLLDKALPSKEMHQKKW